MSIQDAIKQVFAKSKLDSRMVALRIAMDWEQIMGKTINNYTRSVSLRNGILCIKTDIPILRHEFITNKPQLIKKINTYYGSEVIQDLKVIS